MSGRQFDSACVHTHTARGLHRTRRYAAEIKEQMYGPATPRAAPCCAARWHTDCWGANVMVGAACCTAGGAPATIFFFFFLAPLPPFCLVNLPDEKKKVWGVWGGT